MTQKEIRLNLNRLFPWERKVIKGQLKAGDRAGAEKGIIKLLRRKNIKVIGEKTLVHTEQKVIRERIKKTMNKQLELYWSEIPVGKENAVGYLELKLMWDRNEREVRKILHDLSALDNGDDYILIRSAKKGGGFYKTMNADDIKDYKKECLAKGRSTFAPVKKINRVLNNNTDQISLTNNLRVMRELSGLKQSQTCERMKRFDRAFDESLLSKMENGICLPTVIQCKLLSEIYNCDPADLISYDSYII